MAERKLRFQALLDRPRKPYANPYVGGVVLGVTLFLSLFLTANGLGASALFARLNGFLVDLVAPQHVNRVPELIKVAGGSRNPFDNWITFEIIGVVIGAFLSSVYFGRFKPETPRGPNLSEKARWVMAFFGGMIFLYGARMARGCTSGQVLSGGATLSAGSWAMAMVMFAFAFGTAWLVRKLWN